MMEQPSKSRKVKGYLRVHAAWELAVKKEKGLHAEKLTRRATLTGTQLAEVERALRLKSDILIYEKRRTRHEQAT